MKDKRYFAKKPLSATLMEDVSPAWNIKSKHPKNLKDWNLDRDNILNQIDQIEELLAKIGRTFPIMVLQTVCGVKGEAAGYC